MAHDEENEAAEGDKVTIIETRPISARKHFMLLKVVEKAAIKHVEAEPAAAAPVAEAKETPVKESKAKAKEEQA
jgi:hypothetical protein